MINPNVTLFNLLKRVIVAPNDRVLKETFSKFQNSFQEEFPFTAIKMTHELTQSVLLASARVRRVKDSSKPLQDLMQRLKECLSQSLQINPILHSHLQNIMGETALENSCIDNFLTAVNLIDTVSFSELFLLLGSDWGETTSSSIYNVNIDYINAINIFYLLIHHATILNAGTQSILWDKCELNFKGMELINKLKMAKGEDGCLAPLIATDLEQLKTSRKTVYTPIGYVNNEVFFISILAIDYFKNGFRLRLLAADNSHILAAGNKESHYCPEVIWEGLEIDQLTQKDLWEPLLEAATLTEQEQLNVNIKANLEEFLAFNSTHLVPWLSRQLGKKPQVRHISEIPEECWTKTLNHPYHKFRKILTSSDDSQANDDQKFLLLKPTGKEIKRTLYQFTVRKFVNLLPLDLIPLEKDRLLFKAESRLLLLTSAYMSLRQDKSTPPLRGNFLRLIEQSWGKVTVPIERLMQLDPSEEQLKSARIILTSVLDLKHRVTDLVSSRDRIQLSAPKPLYPSTHIAHCLNLSDISHLPVKHTLIDFLRLNEDEPPLPVYDRWTAENFPALHSSLSKWYDLLLDAKHKCEPVEIITLAHRNVFSKLPIPSTEKVEDTFPDQISEGLQVGTLLLLKKISSLVASEVYTEAMVPPIFVADMARVYRFAIELYRHINPEVCKMPVSWFGLHKYLESRHSFQTPGEIKTTLDALAASFILISPKGHLQPSSEFTEIPLFYMPWEKFPLFYKFHRKSLGPLRYGFDGHMSIEQVLSEAELADSVGLKPEETNERNSSAKRWENSFGGQCVLAIEEIAQYHTMSIFATTNAYQHALTKKSYREYSLFDNLGPEDYFQLEPSRSQESIEYSHNFGGNQTKYNKQVNAAEISMLHRMVSLNDKQIREPLSDIPVNQVDEWREQADLIKALPKQARLKGKYQLHQTASGPSTLSLDVLLEYFEARPALLLNVDYRSYFWAIITSSHVLETACASEPLLLDRFKMFMEMLYKEDQLNLKESNLNFERLLWLSALARHLCRLSNSSQKKFNLLLEKILQDLGKFTREHPSERRLVPHLLASQQFLPHDIRLSLPELARFHLLMGRNPPTDPNDMSVWLEATEAMQIKAPEIQESLIKGDETTRQALWSLIFQSESDVAKAMTRRPLKLSLAELAKTSAQMERLRLKQTYLHNWNIYWKKKPWRQQAWKESATHDLLKKVNENVNHTAVEINNAVSFLLKTPEELFLFTQTTFLIQIDGRIINVDWQTGRITGDINLFPAGTEKALITGNRLPVHLRKHPYLAPLKGLLNRKTIIQSQSGIVYFQDISSLSLDTLSGKATLKHNGQDYRLVAPTQVHSMELPDQLKDGFSVWIQENSSEEFHSLLVAHSKDDTPYPAFNIDNKGFIHPLDNIHLRLASTGYYPEAEIFARWGIEQKHILVWLDSNDNVAELYVPLSVEGRSMRIIRTENGTWRIKGLDLQLEDTNESIPAFAGHPVYLVAKNADGHRFLLLPGATPYEIKKRKQQQSHEIDWNQIIVLGPKEGIYQYRILPSGQIEGLTVADNLLFMLWSVYIGRYSTAAALAKRWLTPPGRSYTADEERILSTWVNVNSNDYDSPMQMERHPSALSLRLYVITRMARHMRYFPSLRKEGKKMSELASQIIGNKLNSYKVHADIKENLTGKATFGRQMRGTNFQELLSTYDHEAAVRLNDNREEETVLSQQLYLRQMQNQLNYEIGSIEVQCNIDGHEIYTCIHSTNTYLFRDLVSSYPTMVQTGVVPIKTLYSNLVLPNLATFFDKAYTLIKDGPSNLVEKNEYEAILFTIGKLRNPKFLNHCIHYFWVALNYHHDDAFNKNLLMWLILEQACLAKIAGKILPELPSIQRRFGLALQGSDVISKEFFDTLINFGNMTAIELIQQYCQEWFEKRNMRYFKQNTAYIDPPKTFFESLKTPWPSELTSEIKRWSQLSSPLQGIKSSPSDIKLAEWNYPIPKEWANIPFPQLRKELSVRLDFLLNEKAKWQKDLLSLANKLPTDENKKLMEFARQIHYVEPLSIDDCIAIALAGEGKFQLTTLLYLEASLEVDHLQRAQKELDLILNKLGDNKRIQKFLDNLLTPHQYLPSPLTLPLMISEYYSNCRLRTQPDQAQLINVLTTNSFPNKGNIIQAIMGSGKTQMIAPMWLQIMLNKGYTPVLCVTSALLRTSLADFQKMMWKRYRTHVRSLSFDRENCTSHTLHNLAETLYISKLEPTVFICAPRDLHALQLMLKERHQVIEDMRERLKRFTLAWSQSCLNEAEQELFSFALANSSWDEASTIVPTSYQNQFNQWLSSHLNLEKELNPLMEESNLLQAILNLFQHQVALLVDEVATCYDPYNLLSFPIGWQTPANPQAAVIGCKIYFEWLAPYYEELNLMNNMQDTSKEAKRQDIYRAISKTAWKEYRELLPDLPSLEIFTAYMMSDCEMGKPMQDFVYKINESPSMWIKKLAQELAYLKYCLTSGLEGALTLVGHVNYGRSKKDRSLYLAIPFQDLDVPKENTLYRTPWKTVLMTCQYYSQEWSDPNQTAELIGFLQGIDSESKDQKILKAATRIWGRRFTDVDLSDCKAMEELTEKLDQARLQPDKASAARLLISSYLKSCVFPNQLKLDPLQLTSSPQDIPMMVAKADAMGGTFGFETTWNPKLVRFPDHSSDATVLKALNEPHNQTCHILPKGGAEAFFTYLESGALDGYIALIDAGAHLKGSCKGFGNEMIAKRLLRALKGFDCVLFYDEQPSGGARLAVMTKSGKTILESSDIEGVKWALNQMKLFNPFTFYDHARRRGADLELKSGRALITFTKIVPEDDLFQACTRCRGLFDGTQSIAYAVPEEMEGEWTGQKVLEIAKEQQRQIEGKANFNGICEQLRGEVRAKIDAANRNLKDFEKRHHSYKTASSFLSEGQDNDLVKTFGSLKGMIRSREAFQRLIEYLVNQAEKIVPESKETIKNSLEAILKWHKERGTIIPEFIREGDMQDDAVQEVNISKDQDRMRLMEEEYERMLGTRNPKAEIPWSNFNHKLIKPSPLGTYPNSQEMPTLYSLVEALKERGFSVPFSKNLLISANLLSTFLGESNCLLTENQKPLHRVLFVRGTDGPTLVLISEGDARYLKEHLIKLSDQQGACVYLAEPNGAINQRGSSSEKIINLWQEGTNQTRSLLLQVLIFQGAALMLDKLPKDEVKAALQVWTKNRADRLSAARIFFEAALDLNPDDMLYYRRNPKLKALFIK